MRPDISGGRSRSHSFPNTTPFQQPLRDLRAFVVKNGAIPQELAYPYDFPTPIQNYPSALVILNHETTKHTKARLIDQYAHRTRA
jgi:hypothetical protein